jgi:hypothetical protein
MQAVCQLKVKDLPDNIFEIPYFERLYNIFPKFNLSLRTSINLGQLKRLFRRDISMVSLSNGDITSLHYSG